ncbi:transposase [Arthrobacter psychrolactophilus]
MLGWAEQVSVSHSFASAWDAGVMLASRRTWWRIAAEIEDQMLRPTIPTQRENKQGRREKPVVKATGPCQAWSWDITDVYSPWRKIVFKVYSVMDIFSRQIVGWRVEEREADHLAVEMFETAIAHHGAPQLVHADSGPAMKSHLLRDALTDHGVELSHNRPYVSNDNPFSESGFRTMKYRPGYPRIFKTVETARSLRWRLRALVQHKAQALRHRPVLTCTVLTTAPGRTHGKHVTTRSRATTTRTPKGFTSGPPRRPRLT